MRWGDRHAPRAEAGPPVLSSTAAAAAGRRPPHLRALRRRGCRCATCARCPGPGRAAEHPLCCARAPRRAPAAGLRVAASAPGARCAEQPRDELGALARHARARHHQVEAGALARARARRRRRASRRPACARRRASPSSRRASSTPAPSSSSSVRSTTSTAAPRAPALAQPRAQPRARGEQLDLVAGRRQRALHARAEQQVRRPARARAPSLLGAQAAELLARRLRAAPHLHDLDAAAAHLAHRQLALDARFVEQPQRAVHGRRGGGVPEAVRDQQPPVPVVVGVGARVAGGEVQRRLDVARLVGDAQVELEVRPVLGQRVDDLAGRCRRAPSRPSLARLFSKRWRLAPIDSARRRSYRALLEGCGLLDRSERGKLALTGAGAVEFLNGQVTNELERPARRARAATRPSSRTRARCSATCASSRPARRRGAPGELLLDTERAALQALFDMIRRFKVGYEVELHKRTLERGLLSLIGPRAAAGRGRRAGSPAPSTRTRALRARRRRRAGGAHRRRRRPALRRRATRERSPQALLRARRRSRSPRQAAECLRDRARPPALRRGARRQRDPAGGRPQRARRQLHQGLLRRAGDGRAAATTGASPTATCAGCASRRPLAPATQLASTSASSAQLGSERRLARARPDRARARAPRGAARQRRRRSAHGGARARSSSCRSRPPGSGRQRPPAGAGAAGAFPAAAIPLGFTGPSNVSERGSEHDGNRSATSRQRWMSSPASCRPTMAAWVIREEREGEPKDAFQLEEIEVPEPGAFEVDRARDGGGRQLQQRVGGARQAGVGVALRRPPRVRPPHRRLGRLGRRLEGRRRASRAGSPATRSWCTATRPPTRTPRCTASTRWPPRRSGSGAMRRRGAPSRSSPRCRRSSCCPSPRALTWEEAASYGLVYFTAYRMLITALQAAGRRSAC